MKRIVSTVLTLLLTFSLCFAASATEEDFSELNVDEYSDLTVQEVKTLQQDVGLTIEEIESMPPHILKMLIEQNAKKLASETITYQFDEGQFMEKSAPLANDEDMKDVVLQGTAFEVDSDRREYKKYYLYGNFEWTDPPSMIFTDKMTIGYPDTAEFFIPMNTRGKPDQHENSYCYKPVGYSWKCEKSTNAKDWDPGIGVSAEYDLLMGNKQLHKGYIGQYVYTEYFRPRTFNIKYEYGHAVGTGEIGVSFSPAGLSLVPGFTTEVKSFGIEFRVK